MPAGDDEKKILLKISHHGIIYKRLNIHLKRMSFHFKRIHRLFGCRLVVNIWHDSQTCHDFFFIS